MSGIDPELVSSLLFPLDPQVSPDGRRVAWTVTTFGMDGEHPEAGLWVADVGGDPGRQWTFGNHDSSPRWSPDGSRLAFLSDRKERGTHGVYVLDVAGGEARPVVVRKRDVAAVAWSPDGGRLAFLAPDEPDDEDERREKDKDDAEVHGERWQRLHLWLVEVDGDRAEPTRLDDLDRHLVELAWSPDGTRIAVLADDAPTNEDWGSRHVVVVPITGEASTVCAAPYARGLGWVGDELVFLADHDLGVQTGSTAWSVPAAGAEPRVVGTGREEPRCTAGMATDGTRALVAIADGLDDRLEWVEVATGERTLAAELPGQPLGLSFATTGAGPVLAVVLFDAGLPVRVLAGPPDDLRDVVDHGADLPDVELGVPEALAATAPDGTHLDAVLIRPAPSSGAGAGPWPTVVLVHGGPYGRDTLEAHVHPLDWGQLLATRGYAVVMPNYRGSAGRGHEFAAAARGTMGSVEWDDVLAVTDAAVAAGVADPDRLGIGGWSQGGFMTAWAVTATDRFKAGVMGAGVSDWLLMAETSDIPDIEAVLGGGTPWDGPGPHRAAVGSPISHAARRRTPLLILHGADDVRVPHSQAVAFRRALRGQDAPLEMVTYPREGHLVRERRHQVDLQRRVVAWFDRFLKEGA
ncbi:alpha/beta hydrolase family protein [Nocardioides plantarum]|uniref:S9 family peptidase n=1 Tax=Nocardioides plantarum TaxID=29299 RepID=A0ABV5K9K5_9ACTN|nr:S9 family peptidase [Nocardioides plantarum]